MDLKKYLFDVFGESSEIKKLDMLNNIPLIILNEYEFYEGDLHGMHCIFMKLLTQRILVDKIQKHFNKLNEIIVGKCVLIFDELRPYQRRNLVENRVAFIVPGTQIYLPFICLDFQENIHLKKTVIDRFTASTQCVYLSILYQENEEIILSQIAERIDLSPISINRAIRNLVALDLVEETGKSTRKKYMRIVKNDYWKKGRRHLINPIQKILYLKELQGDVDFFYSNETALSKLSTINNPSDETYAIDKRAISKIDKNLMFIDESFDRNLSYKVEVWKYNPEFFAKNGAIDICSLFAELKEVDDPRIEIVLDRLIEDTLCEV